MALLRETGDRVPVDRDGPAGASIRGRQLSRRHDEGATTTPAGPNVDEPAMKIPGLFAVVCVPGGVAARCPSLAVDARRRVRSSPPLSRLAEAQ